MVLAFRLYGNFHWPPRPDVRHLADKTENGIVEIHYAEKAGAFRPFLRWTPGEITTPPETLPKIHDSIFTVMPDEAVEWFRKHTDADCAIWIDDGSKKQNVDWISFRGAFLIDQYEAADPGAEASLKFRWPLVRACSYAPDHKVFSTLNVGRRNGGPRFCLNLHLPLPARRATLLSGSHVDPPAFPFCAVYEPGKGEVGKVLEFTTLVGGWIEGDSVDTSRDDISQTSFVFADAKYPSPARLGTFGFAARGEPSQGGFAIYDGKHKYPQIDGKQRSRKIDAEKFWPGDARVFTRDVLARYGFSIGAGSAGWPRLKAGASTADLSLRFPRNEEKPEPRAPSFVYRIAVLADGSDPTTSDDIRKGDTGLSLRLYRETGGWISTARNLYADCRLRWNIPDTEIWSKQPKRWSPRTDVSLHWKNDIPAGLNLGSSPGKDAELDFGLLRHAAHSFRRTRQALPPVESGQPRSMLADLQANGAQKVCFTLYGPPLDAYFVPSAHEGEPQSGLLVWGRTAGTGNAETPFIRPRMRLTLAGLTDLIPNSDDTAGLVRNNRLALIASGQTFFNAGFNAGKLPVKLHLALSCDDDWVDAGQNEIADGEPFFASYRVEVTHPGDAWSGRLSSLSFNLSPRGGEPKSREQSKHPDALTTTFLRAGGPGVQEGMADAAPAIDLTDGRIAASIHLALPVTNVEPAGVDVSRMDRSGRPAPLLIRHVEQSNEERKDGKAYVHPYWLGIKETIAPTQDRWIEADVYESAAETGAQSYVVISHEPFSVFRYTHRPLSDRGDTGSASVAYYSGDDRIWQYRKVAEHYHYVLPPQAVGESADKPRRLEVHDLDECDASDLSDALRPYVKEFDEDRNDVTGLALKRRAVEFRLTPSTEFWIRPSDVERGYFMPESTSYEIFRQRGEYGLGAALAFLRGEFLYGLPVGVDTAREGSIARQARVAEIEALTGKITGPARDADADNAVKARWNALTRAIARRPERLEVWARDPDTAVDFTPARFADGVTFSLRGTALHRPPLAKLEAAGDQTLWPKFGRSRPDPATSDVKTGPYRSKPRTHPQGLSGGALWPVESINLFNELLERPESTGGTIESIGLSPIGGDATQKATFLGGIVTIISETRNGHIERQKVEVLGRIGAFWHRAKHVVVYERTVNASAQFAPKFEEDKKYTRSRRPIVRKVREYIELLEHERAYPDFSVVSSRCAGFLERVRFNSRIINVDSAWSSEIGEYGWKIPLWNLLSARERPQVYPMPDIAFVTTAEGDGDKPVVSQECIDTDNLFFFSDFKAATSDTNAWLSHLDIDYANMPLATAIASVADAKQPNPPAEKGGRRRAVSRVLPGVRRFTWRLAPAAQKTAINAGRAGKPVYVGLDSVSFMRAAHVADEHKGLPANLGKLLREAAALPQTGADVNQIDALPYWNVDTPGIPVAGDYSAAIRRLTKALEDKDGSAVGVVLQTLNEILVPANLPAALKEHLGGAAAQASSVLRNFTSLTEEFDKGSKHCEKLKSDAAGMIKRKEMLISTALSDWTANIRGNFPKLETETRTPITTKNAAIEALCGLILSHLRPVFADASEDVGKAGEGAEKARAIAVAVEADIEAVFSRARRRVEEFSAGYDRDKPWSAERRKSFRAGLRMCVGNIGADVGSSIDEARERLAVELGGASQPIAGHLAKALKTISKAAEDAGQNVATVEGDLQRLVAPLLNAIDALAPETGGGQLDLALARIAAVQADINGEAGISGTLRKTTMDTLKALSEAAAQAKTLLGETRLQLKKLTALTDDTIGELRSAVIRLTASTASIFNALQHKADGLAVVAEDLVKEGFDGIAQTFADLWEGIDASTDMLAGWLDDKLLTIAEPVDFLVASALRRIAVIEAELRKEATTVYAIISTVIDDIGTALTAVRDALGPNQLLETVIRNAVVKPALETLLAPVGNDLSKIADALDLIHDRLTELSATASSFIRSISGKTLEALDDVSAVCETVFGGAKETREYLQQIASDFAGHVDKELGKYQPLANRIRAGLADLDKQAAGLVASVKAFDHSVRSLQNDLSRSMETARMYGDRVFDAVSRLDDGGAMALPSNMLKLYSAVSSAPEISALKADIDRIRSGFDELSDIIDTTEASALFNRLGDELKSIGLDMPFDKIGDRLLLKDLKLNNFGGLNLSHLFKGQPIPASVRDAVRVSHDFDKAQARAWVQIDIDARMPGRCTLFSLGVFQIDFVDMHLTGRVRLEASKDQDRFTQTGFSRIGTTIDVVVAGQSMVRFEQFGLNFTREGGLKVEFDPNNIRLNPSFKFIQDFLSTLFPDKAGGLKIVKQDNIPVGVEHVFAIPPMTLNFGTSGVSNISIENHFKLLAYPDFMIANRFNLSTRDRPFIFSIFVIGGTGYIQIDAEYRPFDSQLMVSVEAGAGGSAALAFAAGPFAGQVFITLSGVMTYRKMIGKPGGGLSISVVLVIAGQVDVCGIASVGITRVLRMSYRENGAVDGQGSLSVTIRISRFFKITARANVNYKLRGGKSETSVSSGVSGEFENEKLDARVQQAKQAVEHLQKASN